MTPDRWRAITEVFHAALARDAAARASFVADACGDDGRLRTEVEALLAAHAAAGSFGAMPLAASAVRQLDPGTRLGPYRIDALIGVGGMGEVYRATDTRLDRTVAIKILPAHLRSSADLQARFELEARTISRVAHPHICTLYDIGHEHGVDFLVMEHLEGETLADRLSRGAIPRPQALRIGIDIATALDHAHRHRIVHRDLKPANVMLTKAGAKLLDFGIAKLRAAGVATSMPTTDRHTTPGVLVGTPRYMAPEQLEGREADARSDIWSFGCVLYEMATGHAAFEEERLETLSPPLFDAIVRSCVAKDPDDRWQSASDITRQLQWLSIHQGDDGRVSAPSRQRVGMALAATGLVTMAAVVAIVLAGVVPRRSAIELPTHTTISVASSGLSLTSGGIAISPNGRTLVFAARAGDDDPRLYARSLDRWDSVPLKGTEGAINPFFSRDGEWIAFIAGGVLQKVPLGGGAPQSICKANYQANSRGQWEGDGGILVNLFPRGIYRVPSEGGEPQPVLPAPDVVRYLWPRMLADGKSMLLTVARGIDSKVAAYSIGGAAIQTVIPSASCARYLPSGHLVYESEGHLRAVGFDPRTLQTRGDSRVVVDEFSIGQTIGATYVDYDVSGTGTLVYLPPSMWMRRLVWRDRAGRTTPLPLPARPYYFPALSADGRQIAVTIPQWPSSDVWVGTAAGDALTRLASLPISMFNLFSPDGQWVAFSALHDGWFSLFRVRADGSGQPERLTGGARNEKPTSWSASGNVLLANEQSAAGVRDVVSVDTRHPGSSQHLVDTPANEIEAVFSPDERWIAYQSDESGRWEIYVRPYPGPGGRRQVSTDGGMGPLWNPRGGELFYQTRTALMAVRVKDGVALGPAAKLFSHRKGEDHRREFDVTPDGERFLLLEPATPRTEINMIVNWFDELKARVPVSK